MLAFKGMGEGKKQNSIVCVELGWRRWHLNGTAAPPCHAPPQEPSQHLSSKRQGFPLCLGASELYPRLVRATISKTCPVVTASRLSVLLASKRFCRNAPLSECSTL